MAVPMRRGPGHLNDSAYASPADSPPMPSLSKKREAELAKLKRLIPPEDDPHRELHGVLLSDEIAFYADNHELISPFDRENLKPAAYELTIGDEYFLSGEFLTL